MYPGLSESFIEALHLSHGIAVRVDAYLNGAPVMTSAGVPFSLDVIDGSVTVDSASRVRRVLTVTIPQTDEAWDLLSPVGTELRAYRGIRFPGEQIEPKDTLGVPLGRFLCESQTIDYTPGGTITLTCPDLWSRIVNAVFLKPRPSTEGTAVGQIIGLVTDVFPTVDVIQGPGLSVLATPYAVWAEGRDDAIATLAKSIGVEVFFDNDGVLVVRNEPTIAGAHGIPAWSINSGTDGVQLTAQRIRDRSSTKNVVIVRPSNTEGSTFNQQLAWDTDPTSETYAGATVGGVPNGVSAFGVAPLIISNELITTTAQALEAARAQLEKSLGLNAQLTLTSICHPGLDAGDAISVRIIGKLGTVPRTEMHLVQSLTIPLIAGTEQTITTQSSKPAEDAS